MLADDVGDLLGEGGGVGDFEALNHEGLEFVVTVFVFMVVVVFVVMVVIIVVVMVVDFVAGVEVVFGGDALAKEDVYREGTHGGFDHLDAVAGFGFEFAHEGGGFVCVQKVGFVDHDHVGTGDLVFEEFGERRFVIEVFIHGPLGIDGGDVVGKAAFGDGFTIHHGDNAVHGDTGADFGPVDQARTSGWGRARPEVSITM